MTVQLPATVMFLTPDCMLCGGSEMIRVRADGLAAYEAGALIQDAFPELSDDERELIKTGTHPACWDQMLPDEE